MLRSTHVQTWALRKVLDKVEKKTGGAIQVGKVKIRWPNQISIDDLVVWDQLGDTLLSIPETRINIRDYNWKTKEFDLGLVRMSDPFVYIQEDPGGGMNLKYVLENILPDSVIIIDLDLKIKKIILENGRFKLHKFRALAKDNLFSVDYMDYNDFLLKASDFRINPEEISFNINKLEVKEISGLELKNGQMKVLRKDKIWYLAEVELESANSQLIIPEMSLHFKKDTLIQGIDKLLISGNVNSSTKLSESDFQFFIPDFRGSRDVYLSGDFELKNSQLKWLNGSIDYDDLTSYRGNIMINGVQDLLNAHYSITVDTFWYATKIHDLTLPGLLIQTDTLNIPVNLDTVGLIGFKGVFEGNLKTFEAQGFLTTAAGNIQLSLNSRKGEDEGAFLLSGSLSGEVKNINHLFEVETGIEEFVIAGDFEGSISSLDEFDFDLDFIIPRLNFNNYYYRNLTLDGKAVDKTFDGVLIIEDENIELFLETVLNFQKEIPSYILELRVHNAHLNELNFSNIDSLEVLSLNMHGSFTGNDLENLEGQIWITDSYYQNTRGRLPIKEIDLTIGPELGKRKINIVSDYIDARIFGDIHLNEMLTQFEMVGRRFLPLNIITDLPKEGHLNDFSFNIQLKNPKPLTTILTPFIIFKDNTQVNGFFKRGGLEWEIEGFSPQYVIAEKQFTDLAFRASSSNDSILFNSFLSKLQINRYTEFDQVQLAMVMTPELLVSDLSWENRDSVQTKGKIHSSFLFEPGIGKWPRVRMSVPHTQIIYKDTLWNISPFELIMDKFLFRFNGLKIQHGNEMMIVNGSISDQANDTLNVEFHNLNLDHINTFKGEKNKFALSGIANGEMSLFDLHQRGLFLADLRIADFAVNGELLGHTRILSNRSAGEKDIYMEILASRGDISTLGMQGRYNPETEEINFDLNLEKLRMNIFNGVLDPIFRDIRGIATGNITVNGTRSEPLFNGDIFLQKTSFYINYLNTRYSFTHHLKVTPNGFLVENLIARDKDGNEAIINGGVIHNKFKDLRLDLGLNVTNFLCLNTNEANGDLFWGQAYATGFATISGPLKNIKIDVTATAGRGTDFSLPVAQRRKVRKIDFIRFVEKDTAYVDPDLFSYDKQSKTSDYDVDLSGLELKFDIDIDPAARIQIIIDSQTGERIRAKGHGNLNIYVNTRGSFGISGDYIINEGDYQFTLQNMPIKRFEIEPGGRVTLNGPISDALIDVDAIYSTKATLYDLVLDETNTDLRQRIPVECHLLMNGQLGNPELEFDIVLPPNSDDIARSQLRNLSPDEMRKQIFSLLILNQFTPLPGLSSGNPRSYESAGIATTTEVLSNQLNYLLSQISNDFDIGFNYRPGDELTSDEVAVALKAQLLEDRMTINVNGNVDVRSVETDANQLVGDVRIDYKIIPSGKLSVKAFTRANDRLLYEYSQYTQGFGVFFREEFDTFGALMKKYWEGIFKK